MMRILVTGGLGFIGMNFINYWLSRYEDEILNLDLVTYASNSEKFIVNEKSGNYEFVKGDICDPPLVKRLIKDVDCVVNFAAQSHVDNSITDSSEFIRTNIMGTYVLLEAIRDADARIHHISTDEVFGALNIGDPDGFTEFSCYRPKNPYSATKASADHLVNAFVNTYGIKATISNCSNNFGPLQHPEKLIPKTILKMLSGKKVELYGDGKQIRDWIYVEDHCSAIDTILTKGKIGESYLIGAQNERTNIEVVQTIAEILELNSEDAVEFIEDRPGHDRRYAINANKMRNELGWNPKFNFTDAMRKSVEFYRNNFNFFLHH